jgi:hypothetical protein
VIEPGLEIQKAEVEKTVMGSRKITTFFLELSRVQLYFVLHAVFIGSFLLYQSLWIFSKTTSAYCYAYNEEQLVARGQSPGTLVYHYVVNNKMYRETTTRNEIPLTQHAIQVRYLSFYPAVSRIDSFYGNWAGFVVAWGIFFCNNNHDFFYSQ